MGMPTNGCNSNGRGAPSITGIILIDGAGRPIYYNCEAIAIMTYPRQGKHPDTLGDFLPHEIRSLLRITALDGPRTTAEFTSGRRSYVCRVFALNGNSATDSRKPFDPARTGDYWIARSGANQQADCCSHEYQPQHGKNFFPFGHDKNGS